MHHQVESQDAVFSLMGDPATHGGNRVERIDTHAAAVFLAGERAYKIKRAVRFPFLDYGDLAKRKAACAAELEVNRAFAPDIYRRIVAITREASGLALDGGGKPVEWAVEMRRFDVDATLDRLAAKGRIDPGLADALARAVAAAHAKLPVVEAAPWLEALARFIAQNAEEFAESPDLFPADAVAALTRASRDPLTPVTPQLRKRGSRGLIRRGHGDLHLGNIVLIDGQPVAFDAIEFDPLIAAGDVLYDLAFLLMDLVERGLGGAANVVLNRYLTETRREEDLDALAALPLFLSLRAAIRAKVTAARRETATNENKDAIAKSARSYFDLACALIAPPPARLIAVGGLSGTGKSVLAAALAPEIAPAPGAVVLRSDVKRKAMFGIAETEKLPAEAYRPEVTTKLYRALAAKARRVMAAGHSAIVDAVFSKPEERELLTSAAGPLTGLFLVADLATRVARVGKRVEDASDADAAIARQQENYDLGTLDWRRVDANGNPSDTLAHARAALKLSSA